MRLLVNKALEGLVHATGWRRLIGSPKKQIIFHKRATKYRSLLRKMTYKDKGSYESSPPCIFNHYFTLGTLDVLLLVLIEFDECVFTDTKQMTKIFV